MTKFKKFITGLLIVITIILIVNFIFIIFMAKWSSKIDYADVILVLGAAINTPALDNRTLHGLKLYQEGKAGIMVLSGGKIADSDISEAAYMEKIILQNASAPVNYILEDQSHNTLENIKFSQAKLPDNPSIIIVSDEFHLARAVLLAKNAGFKSVFWSAPQPTYYTPSGLRYYYAREFFATISYLPSLILR